MDLGCLDDRLNQGAGLQIHFLAAGTGEGCAQGESAVEFQPHEPPGLRQADDAGGQVVPGAARGFSRGGEKHILRADAGGGVCAGGEGGWGNRRQGDACGDNPNKHPLPGFNNRIERRLDAEHLGGFRAGGVIEDVRWRPALEEASAVQEDEFVGEREGLAGVVGHNDGGDAGFDQQGVEFGAQTVAQLYIESGERFVEEQKLRLAHEGAGEGHAVLWSAGEARGHAAGEAIEPEPVHGFANARLTGRTRQISQPAGNVPEHGEVGKERVILENEPDPALLRGQKQASPGVQPGLPVKDDAPRRRPEEPGKDAQKRAFPRSGLPEEHGDTAGFRRQADLLHPDFGFVRVSVCEGYVECRGHKEARVRVWSEYMAQSTRKEKASRAPAVIEAGT